jgi:hypothetical protein
VSQKGKSLTSIEPEVDPLSTTMSTSFEIPTKRILSSAQLTAFQSSATYNTLVSYVEALNVSVVGVKLGNPYSESPVRFPHFNLSI